MAKTTRYLMDAVQLGVVAAARLHLELKLGFVALLLGPPGSGKTGFAFALAKLLGAEVFQYNGNSESGRDLYYEFDVTGIVRGERGYIDGPLLAAFRATKNGKYALLLVDEVDKADKRLDAFLLNPLQQWAVRDQNGNTVTADPAFLVVLMTSNSRRQLPEEVLRRGTRVSFPMPAGERLREIVKEILPTQVRHELVALACRVGEAFWRANPANGPCPDEIAKAILAGVALSSSNTNDPTVWRALLAGNLSKDGNPETVDAALKKGKTHFDWAAAFRVEANKQTRGFGGLYSVKAA